MRDLFVAEGVEEIALVFIAVEPAQQLAFAVDIGAAHVVTGGDVVSAEVFCGELKEGFEFDLFVAQDIRVRRTACFILFEEQLEDVIPVFCGKVDGMQFNTELIADGLRVGEVGSGGAVFLTVVFLPVLHEQAFHLIPLLLQKVGGNRGIDAAGHADDHFLDFLTLEYSPH